MKLANVSKGRAKQFAKGGKTPMFGKGDRTATRSTDKAEPQRAGRVKAARGARA
jgi:hypothetical protein